MPRPCKTRRICAMPGTLCFGPRGGCSAPAEAAIMQDAQTEVTPNAEPEARATSDSIHMTLDEYETIRLIDFTGCTQEEAAVSMGVARTTVQAIYESARRKIAQALCLGRELRIGGGNYFLCEGRGRGCRCPRCRKEETE